MVDKQTPLILDALARAAAEPAGVLAYSTKAESGLFPNTVLGKAAAKRCIEERLLEPLPGASGGMVRERCTITDRGLSYLADVVHPKKILEDFVRVLEERSEQVRDLLDMAGEMASNLKGLTASVSAVLPRVESVRVQMPQSRLANPILANRTYRAEILAYLNEWRPDTGGDCPLPQLYRAVTTKLSDCTIGQFHDALRDLQSAGQIYLHPWTGPLYAMPEPGYALLAGHNVAYYASVR
jgi:hypothetical protein